MAINASFLQEGDQINYIPSAAVLAGAIVLLGDIIGVATEPIAASGLGTLGLKGCYKVLKSGSTGPVFAVGDVVLWDSVNATAVRVGAAGSGIFPVGTCIEAAATGDAFVYTRLNPQSIPACMWGKTWEDVTLAGGSKTLDAEDIGKVINITAGHATNVVTLPAIAAGLGDYVIRAGVSGSRIAISPNSVDKFMGPDLTGTDDKDRILAAATALMGDYIQLTYGGANGYAIVSQRGVWSNEP